LSLIISVFYLCKNAISIDFSITNKLQQASKSAKIEYTNNEAQLYLQY